MDRDKIQEQIHDRKAERDRHHADDFTQQRDESHVFIEDSMIDLFDTEANV